MAIESGIGQILTKLSGDFIKFSLDKVLQKIETRNAILIIKESLARELRLALELLAEDKNEGDNGSCESKVFVECVELTSFEEVSRSGVPLAKILKDSIDDSFWIEFNLDNREKGYVKNIRTGNELLERTYLRLKIHKIRLSFDGRQSNIEYLRKLIRASLKTLDTTM